jgi:hypothetical protein
LKHSTFEFESKRSRAIGPHGKAKEESGLNRRCRPARTKVILFPEPPGFCETVEFAGVYVTGGKDPVLPPATEMFQVTGTPVVVSASMLPLAVPPSEN